MDSDLWRAQENLRMLATCPTWYDHLDKIEATIAEEERIYKVRTAAGWELDEEGWFAPCPETGEALSLWNWLDLGLPLPEELDEK
tara:strand:- start:244 stop:498 length:255 start_codon:yes stop_codon:yes gene_type:complete